MDYNWIPWLISFCLLLFSGATYFRNGKKDSTQELASIKESVLKANMKLDTVCGQLTSLTADFRTITKDIADVERRVTVLESKFESMKGE